MKQIQQEQKEKKVFNKVIFIEQDVLEQMQRILDIEEGHAEEYDEDAVIEVFSTVFDTPYRKYGVDIKVCNGDTPYVDPVVYEVVEKDGVNYWFEIFPLDVSDTLEGEYTFEIEEDDFGVEVVLNVLVVSMDSVKENQSLVLQNVTPEIIEETISLLWENERPSLKVVQNPDIPDSFTIESESPNKGVIFAQIADQLEKYEQVSVMLQ